MESLEGLLPDLQSWLEKMIIRGVDLRITLDLLEQGATELGPDGITILIGNTLNGVHTVNQEAIHILKAGSVQGSGVERTGGVSGSRVDQEIRY